MPQKSLDELARETKTLGYKIDEKIQSIKRRNRRTKTSIFTTLFFLTSLTAGYLSLVHFPRKKVEKQIQNIMYLVDNKKYYEADKLSDKLQYRLRNKGVLEVFFNDLYDKLVNYDDNTIDVGVNSLKLSGYNKEFAEIKNIGRKDIKKANELINSLEEKLEREDFDDAKTLLEAVTSYKNEVVFPRVKQVMKLEDYNAMFDKIKESVSNKDYKEAWDLFASLKRDVEKEEFTEAQTFLTNLNYYYNKNIRNAIQEIGQFDSIQVEANALLNNGINNDNELQRLDKLQSYLSILFNQTPFKDELIQEKSQLVKKIGINIEKYKHDKYVSSQLDFYQKSFREIRWAANRGETSQTSTKIKGLVNLIEIDIKSGNMKTTSREKLDEIYDLLGKIKDFDYYRYEYYTKIIYLEVDPRHPGYSGVVIYVGTDPRKIRMYRGRLKEGSLKEGKRYLVYRINAYTGQKKRYSDFIDKDANGKWRPYIQPNWTVHRDSNVDWKK